MSLAIIINSKLPLLLFVVIVYLTCGHNVSNFFHALCLLMSCRCLAMEPFFRHGFKATDKTQALAGFLTSTRLIQTGTQWYKTYNVAYTIIAAYLLELYVK